MTLVIGDITVSLDGFVDGPDDGVEAIHAWALRSDDPVDRGVLERHVAASGAVVMGRRTFDDVDRGWSDGMGYGATVDARPPFVVVTSSPPAEHRLAATHTFTFVTDGPATAIRRARAAAGDRDVFVMGGGALVGSCLRDGLLDELRLHLAPEVLGGGTPLSTGAGRQQLQQASVEVSRTCTHLTYRGRR
ncbi:Dihydrofolate reductase [Geodermatophilus saharensis]|uniref:Dihydrofolate reductase n=1 Tax=Geodermatophilus saharensis TaxID=1137994 RepID=A0A239CKK2_9ACTN|nr:dihydrofolate reductase family protein [Geodermatophilus saharensis]SNS20687.1 Dihydrofolate reductase [Geodermatophilus saharensis]